MRSVTVKSNGGLSVLSAFATGKGGACSVDLPMEVSVSSGKGMKTSEPIERVLAFLTSKKMASGEYTISVRSTIPEANGLKSSSALVLSVIVGILRLEGIAMNDADLLRTAAEASLASGTSSTGAMDDLAACFYGGYCLTDNRQQAVLKRGRAGSESVLIVPSRKRKMLSSQMLIPPERDLHDCFNRALLMAERGNIYGAMELNGFIMASYTGIDFQTVGLLIRNGASYASQSGKGPALFGIFPSSSIAGNMGLEDCIFTHFTDEGIRVVEEP